MSEVKKQRITAKGLRKSFKLFRYIKPYRAQFGLGLFFLFGSSLANLAFPKFLGDIVNMGNEGMVGAELTKVALLLAGILIVQAVFSYFRIVLFVNVSEKALADIRQDTYNHLIKLPLSFFEQHRVGELNSRISADISLLQETLTSTLAQFIRQIIIITGGIALLAITSPKLTLFMLAVVPVTTVVARFFGRFIRGYAKNMQKEVANSNTVVEETLQGIHAVKAFTNEMYEVLRYKQRTEEIAKIGIRGGKYRGAFSAFIILGLFGAIVAVIWRGSMLLADKQITAGEMFSFVIYSVFIGGTISGMAGVFATVQKFIGATEDLFEITNIEEEPLQEDVATENDELQGNIELKNLFFAYPSRGDEFILKDISLSIEANQLIAVVGASGAGKTTLASLLLRFHEPSKGEILFDGKLSSKYSLTSLRKQISLVPQDVFLFGGTIRENIAYGKPDATDEEIYEAAQKANALEFIERFPNKFETLVGERGMQVSGGQRQRIAIARAILKNPKILILDEATSSLDSESERLIQDALGKLMKNRTSIVIAHRLATIRNADQIFVLKDGRIVETGKHEDLMNKPEGIYRNLSELQFAG